MVERRGWGSSRQGAYKANVGSSVLGRYYSIDYRDKSAIMSRFQRVGSIFLLAEREGDKNTVTP